MTISIHDTAPASNDDGAITQLLYRSRSLSNADSALMMSDILAQARPANARDGISGVLTVAAGRFIQIIEGSAASIEGLLARLVRDARHSDLKVIERRQVAHRSFADWDMVSPRIAADQLALVYLLLDDETAGLDDYIPVLTRAIVRQDAVLEGRKAKADMAVVADGTSQTYRREA